MEPARSDPVEAAPPSRSSGQMDRQIPTTLLHRVGSAVDIVYHRCQERALFKIHKGLSKYVRLFDKLSNFVK